MSTYLVTGANRGLGLEFAKQLAEQGKRVFATTRNPASAESLNALAAASEGRVTVVALDVSSLESAKAAAAQVASQLGDAKIDVLINNAGIFSNFNMSSILDASSNIDALVECSQRDYDVNVLGIVRVVNSFFPLLNPEQAKLMVITSGAGSIAGTDGSFLGAGYKSSKAGANMVTRLIATDPANKHVTTIAMCPGWVATDMGSQNSRFDPALKPPESIAAMLAFLDTVTFEQHNGKFFNRKGDEIPF
ncbi:MAG: hypothetical protein MHM6MM_007139 [Cercozoa sp. M6MM]